MPAFKAQLFLLFSKNLKMVAQQFLMGYATFSIMLGYLRYVRGKIDGSGKNGQEFQGDQQ